ncbi:MAG: hypothetical protein ACRDRX_06055 [Pseudonocardiaceae bacterium]
MTEKSRQVLETEPLAIGRLSLPPQAAPIDRTPTCVALTASAGVEASFPFLALAPLAINALSKIF